MRGHHAGSFEVGHDLRDGKTFRCRRTADRGALRPGRGRRRHQRAGGGVVLPAAPGRDARILILDNHDDFGGHAKRNEFRLDGRLIIGYGGSESLQSPQGALQPGRQGPAEGRSASTSRASTPRSSASSIPRSGCRAACSFRARRSARTSSSPAIRPGMVDDDVGRDAAATPSRSREFVAEFPDLGREQGAADRAVSSRPRIRSPARPRRRRSRLLEQHELPRLPDQDLRLQRGGRRTASRAARSISSRSAATRWRPPTRATPAIRASPGSALPPVDNPERSEPYIYHFPDGNASLARLLVRALIPAVAPRPHHGRHRAGAVRLRQARSSTAPPCACGSTAPASTSATSRTASSSPICGTARCTAWRRGTPCSPASTCVDPLHHAGGAGGAARGAGAERQGAAGLHQRAGAQLAALGEARRARDRRADVVPQPRQARLSGEPRRLSARARPVRADVPAHGACAGRASPAIDARTQFRIGRAQAAGDGRSPTSRRDIRDELDRMLGPGGFSSARDIAAITVNRWSHGYAYAPTRCSTATTTTTCWRRRAAPSAAWRSPIPTPAATPMRTWRSTRPSARCASWWGETGAACAVVGYVALPFAGGGISVNSSRGSRRR